MTEDTGYVIILTNGWKLRSLVRIGTGWAVVVEKEVAKTFHPHTYTELRQGTGRCQKTTIRAAFKGIKIRSVV